MLIGIDGRELEGKPTGVGNYLSNILQQIELPAHFKIQLYFKNEIPSDLIPSQVEPVLLPSKKNNLAWLHTILSSEIRRRKIQLFFSPTASCVPFFSGIQTAAVHDLSYYNHPEWFSPRERWVRKISTRYTVHKAQRIYVLSGYVREEIMQRFGVSSDKLLMIPIGVHKKTRDAESRRILRESYGYESARIVLYVGSVFQRRHLPVLVHALTKLDSDVKLVVIGENRTFPRLDLKETARKYSVESRVILLEYASAKIVEDYYRMADVFIYLSTYEGFGIPPLEAMSYGIPVILSRTPAMDEIYKYSALFVPSIAAGAVAESLRACLTDDQLREQLIESGLAQVERSRWSDSAKWISQDWEQLLAARS